MIFMKIVDEEKSYLYQLSSVSVTIRFYPFVCSIFFEDLVCGETGHCSRAEDVTSSCSLRTYALVGREAQQAHVQKPVCL